MTPTLVYSKLFTILDVHSWIELDPQLPSEPMPPLSQETPPPPPPLPPNPLEKFIKCFFCKEYYSDSRRPKVLNCGHTFCSTCMKGVVNCRVTWMPFCGICHASVFYLKAAYIPYNYALDSIVPHVKEHLGLTINNQQVHNNNRKLAALKVSMRKEIEAEIRNNLERDIEVRIYKEVKEKLEIEKTNLSRLKVKLENEYKKQNKNKHLKNTHALMKEEIKTLKALRIQERAEVRRLKNENKKLQSENYSIMQRNKRMCRYKIRSSL